MGGLQVKLTLTENTLPALNSALYINSPEKFLDIYLDIIPSTLPLFRQLNLNLKAKNIYQKRRLVC